MYWKNCRWCWPIPGRMWNWSLTSGSTAVVMRRTFGNAYATECTPKRYKKFLDISHHWSEEILMTIHYQNIVMEQVHEWVWLMNDIFTRSSFLPDKAMISDTSKMFSSGTSWSSNTLIAIIAAAPVATVASINITWCSLISLGSLR